MDEINNFRYNLNNEVNPLLLPNELDDVYKGRECLKFISMNIRSLPKHHDDLSDLLSSLSAKFSCIVLTETFLKNYNKDLYTLSGYDMFNVCRKERKGGVVSVPVSYTHLTLPTSDLV